MTRLTLLNQLRLFFAITLGGAVLIALLVVHFYFKQIQHEQLYADMRLRAELLEEVIPHNIYQFSPSEIDSLLHMISFRAQSRLTLFDSTGQLIGDSRHHGNKIVTTDYRPEIVEALKNGTATIERYSTSDQTTDLYFVKRVSLPSKQTLVLRLSEPREAVTRLILPLRNKLIGIGLIVFIGVLLIGWIMSHILIHPLQQMVTDSPKFFTGNLQYRYPRFSEPVAGQLASAMNSLADELHLRFKEIELQRNELEALLANMVEGVIALNDEGRLIRINRAASEWFGVDTENVSGKLLVECIRNAPLLALAQSAQPGSNQEETLLTLPNGKLLSAYCCQLKMDDQHRNGTLIVLRDVTKLNHLEKIRQEFIANASHELRTPVTSIKGYLEALQTGDISDPEQSQRFLDVAVRQTNRLNAIIEDLLRLSRIERADYTIDLCEFNLFDALEPMIDEFRIRAEREKVVFSVSIPETLIIHADPRLLPEAVMNLLDNAFKYGEGKPVELSAKLIDSEVMILVTDHGPGISLEHQERIFERFYRVDASRSRNLGGTGLGLAIVKHITLAHQGTADLRSELGKGATFTLHIPKQ